MSIRPERVTDLANRLIGEVGVARREGCTDVEIGVAVAVLLARVAPKAQDRAALEAFAARHADKR